jgi:2-deoxy-D-gluconate 3-dehydrogenase
VVGLTRALSNEWAGLGVNVNAIVPAYIATDNTQALRDDPQSISIDPRTDSCRTLGASRRPGRRDRVPGIARVRLRQRHLTPGAGGWLGR